MGCDTVVKTNDRGLGNPQLHGLSPASSVDSRRRSWYVFFTTPYLFGGRVETVLRGGLCLCMGVAIDLQPLQGAA